MAVRGRILKGELKPTLMASQDATLESKLGLIVNRVVTPSGGDGKELPGFETVSVKTGERVDGLVVILEGDLQAGDLLVTRGKEGLYPGAKLNATNINGDKKGAGSEAAPAAADGAAAESASPGNAPPAEDSHSAGGEKTPGEHGK
jgi:hypothetical protein